MRAVSLGTNLPRAMRGQNEAVAIANLNDFQIRDTRGAGTFESMYENTLDQVLNGAGRETFEAVKLMQSIQKQPYAPAGNAQYPNSSLGQDLMQIARLIKSNVGLEVAFAEMRGWDTHVNEVGARPTQGQLANLLGQFGSALAAFYQDLGDRMADVSVVTMSEFGRTARENGSRGTDHGHANVMFAFGGGIRGGKVHGEWPGLEPEQLYEQRDLQLTTDFRDVLGELVVRHLGNARVASVFPGYEQPKFRGIVAALSASPFVRECVPPRGRSPASPASPARGGLRAPSFRECDRRRPRSRGRESGPARRRRRRHKVFPKLLVQFFRALFARDRNHLAIQARLEPLKQRGGFFGGLGQLRLGFCLTGHLSNARMYYILCSTCRL